MNRLLQLNQLGQSYWIDDLSRGMIESGELARRVTEEALRGVTSNPEIFNKAISKSDDYAADIAKTATLSAPELYERLVVSDVTKACDILRRVYNQSEAADGYVSLEVSPHLAHDTQGSIEEARKLWQAVKRPNLFIKIPGTSEGVPAIEQLLVEGINVNITLLFSVERYEAVACAYLRALERRAADNLPVRNVASVASFFLSRIDVLVDKRLQERDADGFLLGKAAIANAKLAYQSFKQIVASERWRTLEALGARPQRMLWASTSTKNPEYHDLMYVEPLIGPFTVNTLPAKTIDAFSDHGVAEDTVEEGLDEARQVMRDLENTGIDFAKVTEELLVEGIEKFIKPYDSLLQTLGERRKDPRRKVSAS